MEEEGEVFLGRSSGKQSSMSGDTAKVIDEEMRDVIDRNYKRAEKILGENEDVLHAMSEALMKYETIDLGQIDKLMNREEPGPPADWGDDGTGDKGAKPPPAAPKHDGSTDDIVGGPSKPAGEGPGDDVVDPDPSPIR